MVNCGVPKDGVKLKLKGVKLGDNEKESAHNIRLKEPVFTLFLQGVVTALCFFMPFHKGVVSADVVVLVNGLHGIFVHTLLDKACDNIYLTKQFLAFGINCSSIHQLVTDEPAVLK